MTPFEEFLSRHGATAELARAIDVTHAAIRQWNGRVPANRIIAVEAATGIPREALRPDLFRRPPALTANEQAA